MNSKASSSPSPFSQLKGPWSPRARLYGVGLCVALVYLLLGRLSSDDLQWVRVYLPLSAASILATCAAGIEAYFLIRHLRRRHAELLALREREREESQRLGALRQTLFNEISRRLLDKLDLRRAPTEALEKAALLFEADVVAMWGMDTATTGAWALRGAHGLDDGALRQLTAITHAPAVFEKIAQTGRVVVTQDFGRDTTPAVAAFCATERLVAAVLNPVVCHGKVVGVVGVFYRQPHAFTPQFAAELQTVANIFAGAIQAEELYRDLIRVLKVDSIGNLATGIAHDFNNVLAAILASASYLRQQVEPQHPAYRCLEGIETSAHRGAALTKQLLSFARSVQPRLQLVNVNQTIEQTLRMLERSFDKTIALQRHLAPDLAPVELDPSHLKQIVLNIAVNACDAMPGGGTFTVATRNVTLDKLDPRRPAVNLPDGQYVCLSFRDTGCGMDEATVQHIFELFFTTKAPGKGTGLGLSVVQSICRSFGGEVRVASAPGKGTLFEVFLPASDKPLPAEPPPPAPKTRGGRERILLVEDEDIIREMAQLELEARGYKVLTASDGVTALERYRQEWAQIDLVIVDMVMPRMSGPELFAKMKEINPGVRVIVSSGYSHDLEGQRMLEQGCLGFLQKPYDAETLCQSIRTILDSGL